ncbi:MAG: Hint domain-containing protein, partial [Rhodobacteraceae bacterium]|nr:Hint domain-containing protein [Paracoccaceae bacterium]
KPVLISQGSLGDGLPERDMLVSPNHRLLVANERTMLYFEEHEVLVAAKHLSNSRSIRPVEALGVTYVHFMCDRHEVVLANGCWTESFQPGDYSLNGLGNAQRNEIFEIFPELVGVEGRKSYTSARRTLKRYEASLLRH